MKSRETFRLRAVASADLSKRIPVARPLITVNGYVMWQWTLTNAERRAVRPFREFFDGIHFERVLDARTVGAKAKKKEHLTFGI